MRTVRIILVVSLFVIGGFFVFSSRQAASSSQPVNLQQAPTDQASIQKGEQVYGKKCLWCHGIKGDGKGPAANFVDPKPRDFTRGEYKFRTSQSGEIPTDWDIYRSITAGIHGTSMYGWEKVLSDQERWDLVAYLKTFSDRFKNEQVTRDKVLTIPFEGDPGKASKALLDQGNKLFHDPNGAKCFMCHGNAARGDGPSADSLTDDWGNKLWPADLTRGYDLRRGDSAQDIFCDISTGLEGSPMPSFRDAIDPDPKKDLQDRWALAYYVKSLQAERKSGSLVSATRIKGDVPTDPDDPRWDSMSQIDIPLAGQILMNPREFTPSVDNVTVKACYNDKSVAFFLSWDDRTRNTTTGNKQYPDAAGIQFPVQIPADPAQSPKPYLGMGDPEHPVDLWYWSADKDKAQELNARGASQVVPKTATPTVSVKSSFKDGMWKVVFTRPLATSSTGNDVQLKVGQYVPLSFAIWDGDNGEHGGQKAISSWYYCLLIPPVSSKVYVAPFIAVIFGIFLELWVARKAKEHAEQSSA